MSRRRKILFLNHVSSVSGAEASLLDTLAALDGERYEKIVILPEPGPLSERLAQAGIRTEFMPLRRFRKTCNPLVLLGHLRNLLAVSRQLAGTIRRERIDLLHANSNNAQIYGGLAARWAGVPCIWHSRDLVELGFLGKWMAGHAARIISISGAVKRHLCQYGPEEKIVTISNGIDTAALEKGGDGAAVRREWGIPDNAYLVGMAGQLVPWKKHALFLKAAAQIAAAIPEARFLIAGANLFDPDSGYEAALRRLAWELGLEGRVTFTGNRADMGSVLASLDLLIHPADKEPLGRVILEAMALGKPVIAVNACGPAEIIHSGADGVLVPANDIEAMAREAIALWRDRSWADRIGDAARARIRTAFDSRAQAMKVEALYEAVLGECGVRRSPRVATVVAEFPSISETFILREMTALEQEGIGLLLFALKRPGSPVVHPEAKPFLTRVHYRTSAVAWASFASVLYFLFTSPLRFLSLLGQAVLRGDPDDGSRLKALYHLLTAAEFARAARWAGATRVHAHFATVTADIGASMAALMGVPFSLSVHAWDIYTRKKEATAARLRKAAFVTVCTSHGRDHVKALCPWLPDERLILMSHGVFPDRFAPGVATEPVILGVGRLEEKKGFRYLIDACRILKEEGCGFRCVIVGEGSLRQALTDQIARNGLAQEVSLAGELTQDKLMDRYGTAMVLAVPSVAAADGDRDGLPNVLIEAMALRIPVAASSLSAISEVVADGVQGLLVPPGDFRRLANALRRLLADEEVRQRMGGQGRETVCRDFDITRNVKRLVELLGGDSAA
jgi:glycosyltransferase involved in cell wall biosynthesis